MPKAKYNEAEGMPQTISTSAGTNLEAGGEAVEVTEAEAAELLASSAAAHIEVEDFDPTQYNPDEQTEMGAESTQSPEEAKAAAAEAPAGEQQAEQPEKQERGGRRS